MAADRVNSLMTFTPRTFLEQSGPAAVGQQPRVEPRTAEETGGGVNRSRYRVDAAYRSYADARNQDPPPRSNNRTDARKVSSAELLDSMIHQMGGGATSSAKGVFVDIAV